MNSQIFKARRDALLNHLDNGIAIIPTSTPTKRSFSTEHPYRQCSNFYYLTGFEEDNAILVLCKNNSDFKSVIFLQSKNPELELWTGERLGVENAPRDLLVDKVYSIDDLQTHLPTLLKGHQNLYIDIYENNENFKTVQNICHKLFSQKKKKGEVSPTNMRHLPLVLGNQRVIKDKQEITDIRKANHISAKAHSAAMAFATPGIHEFQVQSIMEYIFKYEGSTGVAYESIVASGNNANTLHYIKNNQMLKDGTLVLIDAGAEYNNYASDITRTFPANGKFTTPQKELYQLVLNAQKECINMSAPGVTLTEIHQAAVKVLLTGMIDLKILTGSYDELYETSAFKKFYPHGTSHWLGLDVHDNAPYLDQQYNEIKLAEGMIFTIEPGIYLRESNLEIPKHFRGIGIRIEDDILITNSGFENLSIDTPKEITDIEKACARDFKEFI